MEIAAAGMRKQYGIKDSPSSGSPGAIKKPSLLDLVKAAVSSPFVRQLSWHFVAFVAAVFFAHNIAPSMFDYSYLLEPQM